MTTPSLLLSTITRTNLSGVEGSVIVVGVHSSQLDLISGLAEVAKVSKENGVLGSGQAARRNFSGALLDRDPLVVLVQGLLHVDLQEEKNDDQLAHSCDAFVVPSQPLCLPISAN